VALLVARVEVGAYPICSDVCAICSSRTHVGAKVTKIEHRITYAGMLATAAFRSLCSTALLIVLACAALAKE
jgi:hypothetical protein